MERTANLATASRDLIDYFKQMWSGAFMSYPVLAAKEILIPDYHLGMTGDMKT